jgi:anaerobic ribonucleoside-triphosphate reductase activating protein
VRILVDRLHHPVTALGPGRRVGIWLQGCSLACPGCLSRDTWDPEAVTETTVDSVLETARSLAAAPDGVTISGGEPFEQPAALESLVAGIRRWSDELPRPIDVLVYSGLPWHELRREHATILTYADAVIPEPYVAAAPPDGPWRGSGNQPLVLLSELGRDRFRDVDLAGPHLQVATGGGSLWMIGVPRRGDLARFSDAMATRGVELEDVSWRP